PHARSPRPCAGRTREAVSPGYSLLAGLLITDEQQPLVRDLDGLHRDLVLARVELRTFPLADPATHEAPLGVAAVGAQLRDHAGDPLWLHQTRLVARGSGLRGTVV